MRFLGDIFLTRIDVR